MGWWSGRRQRRLRDEASAALGARDLDRAETAFAALAAEDALDAAGWFDWGLVAKRRRAWADCADRNARALALGDDDESTLWNLGIAAEIVRDAARAREAWARLGLAEVGDGGGMPRFGPLGRTPVRLATDEGHEVVWCERRSPARARVLNVPRPGGGRRFGEVVVHDGEPAGHRVVDGRRFTVFDELAMVSPSRLGTFVAALVAPSEADLEQLFELASERDDVAAEDWDESFEVLCAACSRGEHDPHEHDGDRSGGDGTWRPERQLGVAAPDLATVRGLLDRWVNGAAGRHIVTVDVALAAP